MAIKSKDVYSLPYFCAINGISIAELHLLLSGVKITGRDWYNLGKAVKQYRLAQNLSMQELANKANADDQFCKMSCTFTKHTICRIESGKRKLSILEAVIIANVLEVDILDLLTPEMAKLGKDKRKRIADLWQELHKVSTDTHTFSTHINPESGNTIYIYNETDKGIPALLYILANRPKSYLVEV